MKSVLGFFFLTFIWPVFGSNWFCKTKTSSKSKSIWFYTFKPVWTKTIYEPNQTIIFSSVPNRISSVSILVPTPIHIHYFHFHNYRSSRVRRYLILIIASTTNLVFIVSEIHLIRWIMIRLVIIQPSFKLIWIWIWICICFGAGYWVEEHSFYYLGKTNL